MKQEIRHRWTDAVLWSGDVDTIHEAVKAAIQARADLTGANLRGADLTGADLRGANLRGADLTCAVLRGAVLRDAVLRGADLRGADLTGADLTPIRDDLWAVLSSAPAEVPALIAAIKAGQIDGSSYSGTCACLVGTIANARHCDYESIPGLAPNASRPAEVFFAAIHPGDTPDKSQPAAIALGWCEDWWTRMQAAFNPQVKVDA